MLGVSLKLWLTPPLVAVGAVHSSLRWLFCVPVLRSRITGFAGRRSASGDARSLGRLVHARACWRGEPALVDSSGPRYGEKASYYSAVCLETGEVEWMELDGNSNAGTSEIFLRQFGERRLGPLNVIWDNAPESLRQAQEWRGVEGVPADAMPGAATGESAGLQPGPTWMVRWNHLRDVAGGSVNLPRLLTQVLWRDRADEGKERRGGDPAPGLQLCDAFSSSCVSPFGIR